MSHREIQSSAPRVMVTSLELWSHKNDRHSVKKSSWYVCRHPLALLLLTMEVSVQIRDWTNVVLLSGFTLALAVALHAALRKYQHQQPSDALQTADSKPVVSVLQRDVDQERAAEAAPQRYPVGCRVMTKAYGIATVLAFHPETMSYEVLIQAADGSSKRILISNDDVEQTRVQDFYLYPIKSCRGVRLDSVQITAKGIKNDRTWMFADAQGNFITQRRFSRLALVTPKLLPDVENPTVSISSLRSWLLGSHTDNAV